MGCDIHLYKEKKVNGIWVTADEWETDGNGIKYVPYDKSFTSRDYELFGAIAGVRMRYDFSLNARGMPFNACAEVININDCYGPDGHSHSYLTVSELKDFWSYISSRKITISGMMHRDRLMDFLAELDKDNPDYNKLYPYCQMSNHPDYESFRFELPCHFFLAGIQSIIELFDGIDGEDHRIVFWFDN